MRRVAINIVEQVIWDKLLFLSYLYNLTNLQAAYIVGSESVDLHNVFVGYAGIA